MYQDWHHNYSYDKVGPGVVVRFALLEPFKNRDFAPVRSLLPG
jgi:hypothetical protein